MGTVRGPEQGAPPKIDGYEPIRLIGSGGFADVFLYTQKRTGQQVAVKVVRNAALGLGDFAAEASLMAKVSHAHIVQVIDAPVTDDGRTCLIMQYYSGANYYDRARRERFGVDDVLKLGVELASAIETAHRAGVVHRDIKPANILSDAYGKPALTDFGIAAAMEGSDVDEGFSPPWAPPEAFGDNVLDVRSDVYSLAATLFHLLVGRSPFEVPGGDNSTEALMARIEKLPVPPTGASESLDRILAQAMAKDPMHRPPSAEAFARQLQRLETERGHPIPTRLQLVDTTPALRERDPDGQDETHVKGVRKIDAQADSSPRIAEVPADPVGTGTPRAPRRREGLLRTPAVPETLHKDRPVVDETKDDAPASGRRRLLVGAAVGAVALVVVIGMVLAGSRSDDSDDPAPDVAVNDGFDDLTSDVDADIAVPPAPIAAVEGVAIDGGFRFTWEPVDGADVYVVTEDGGADPVEVSDESHESTAKCIEVEVVGETGLVSPPTRGCAP